MCIRDSICALLTRAGYEPVYQVSCRDRNRIAIQGDLLGAAAMGVHNVCLLYTSDAADERSSVDLGGRRIIKQKHKKKNTTQRTITQKINR